MIIFYSILGLLLITLLLYNIFKLIYLLKKKSLNAPTNKIIFWILSLTWGFPMTLIGFVTAFFLILSGHKPKKYYNHYYFEFKKINFGLELGLFFICPYGCDNKLKNHEVGHSIQNIYMGIFTPLIVSIPSVIRYWYRELFGSKKDYDDAWFEGQATFSGSRYIEKLSNKSKNISKRL